MEEKIPQYHASYTEEENKLLHEHIENATEKELVEDIYTLCNLYPEEEQEKLKEALNKFIREIYFRHREKQRYDILLQCEKEWGHYCDSLHEYKDVLLIRKKYAEYKELKNSNRCSFSNFQDFISLNGGLHYSEEFVRKSTFKEESKNGIKKPTEPETFYESIDAISAKECTTGESLEKLERDNLKYFLVMLLQAMDAKDGRAEAIITFLTRKYSYESHKRKVPLFSSKIQSYTNLREKNIELLERIADYKKEAIQLKKEMDL